MQSFHGVAFQMENQVTLSFFQIVRNLIDTPTQNGWNGRENFMIIHGFISISTVSYLVTTHHVFNIGLRSYICTHLFIGTSVVLQFVLFVMRYSFTYKIGMFCLRVCSVTPTAFTAQPALLLPSIYVYKSVSSVTYMRDKLEWGPPMDTAIIRNCFNLK